MVVTISERIIFPGSDKSNVSFQKDSKTWIQKQLDLIENVNTDRLDKKEEFSFYINAYNIITIYAVNEILSKDRNWKGNISLWRKIKFFYLNRFTVGGNKINLYNLEKRILRGKFEDPRVHFVINCASESCPPLPNKLLHPASLEKELESNTKNFITNPSNCNYVSENNTVYLNPIFKWYKKDFNNAGGVISFINRYLTQWKLPENVTIRYSRYSWKLAI